MGEERTASTNHLVSSSLGLAWISDTTLMFIDVRRSLRDAKLSFPWASMTSLGPNFAIVSSAPRITSSSRSEEHTSELQSRRDLVCRLLLEKKKKKKKKININKTE